MRDTLDRRPAADRARRAIAATATLLTTASLLWAVPAQAAEAPPIPQAPVLTVISAQETLPFTGGGEAPTEVAVLTAGQSIDEASWRQADELDLKPYEGSTIRVLARAQGVTDQDQYFDATYDVRNAYESAIGQGTDANPAEAILAGSPKITGWATGYADYAPGENVTDNWKTPQNAVGSIAGNPDDPYSGNTVVVVLGDHGKITMTFANPIFDGDGYDFAVFENGFNSGSSNLIFGELARVQVSSNGTDFVEFDTGTTNETPVSAYGAFAADQYGGTAGRDLNGYGTPFDLSALKNKPQVRSGQVDLDHITAVKIVDIVGDGNDLDSFGRPIYDPFPTYGSGGFDLRAVGAMNQKAVAVNPTRAVGLDTTTVGISTSVSSGQAGRHTVELQTAQDENGTAAVVADSGTVEAGEQGKSFDFRVRALAPDSTFWYRVAVTNTDGEQVAATAWKSFTKTPSQVALSSAPSCSRVENAARCSFVGTFRANSDGPFVRWVEISESEDHGDARIVGRTETQSGQILAEGAEALELGRTYWYRYVGEHADGVRRVSDWGSFTATVAPSTVTPTLVSRRGGELVFRSEVRPGSQTAPKVSWEYATNAGFTAGLGTIEQVPVPTDAYATTFTHTLTGLDPAVRYYVRAVLERDDATVLNSSALNVAPEAAPAPTIQNVVVNATNGTLATAQSRTASHTYGQQSATVEYTADPDRADVSVTEPLLTTGTSHNAALTGLKPATTYWVRGVWRSTAESSGGHVATSEWFEFTTPAVTEALGDVEVGEVTRTSAALTVPVAPGVYERDVVIAARAAGGEVRRTPAQSVPAGAATRLVFSLDDLAPNTAHMVWAESTIPGSEDIETSAEASFTTAKSPASIDAPVVSGLTEEGATVTAAVTTGDVDQQVALEYSFTADGSNASRTSPVDVEVADAPVAVSLTLAGLASGRTVHFRVVARDADGDETATDWASFSTVTPEAPTATVSVPSGGYRVGDEVTITWTAAHADTLTASGGWTGDLDPAGGSRRISLDRAGAYEFTVTGVGSGGRTSVTTSLNVSHRAAALRVATVSRPVAVGRAVTIRGTGLAPSESYTATVGGVRVASGRADARGAVNRSVKVPASLADANQRIVLTGSVSDRVGRSTVRVVRAKRLTVAVTKSSVRRSKSQRVTVRGLAPREPVTVRVLDRTLRGTANAKGVFSRTFRVSGTSARRPGTKKVVVRGTVGSRHGTSTFRVRR